MAAFYVAELLLPAGPLGGLLRGRLLGRGFRWTSAQDAGLRLRGGGRLIWTSALPLRPTLAAGLPPVAFDATGVWILPPGLLPPDPRRGVGPRLRYEEVGKPEREGRTLRLAGHPVRFASPEAARRAATLVAELAALPPEGRPGRIAAHWHAVLDEADARRRVDRFLRASRPLRGAALLLAGFVFVVIPAVAAGALVLTWIQLVAAYAALLASVQLAFWGAHRHLHPEAGRRRWAALAAMWLSPADAMAAPQRLGVDVLAGLHPLAAVRVLGSVVEWRDLAGRLLRGMRHPPEVGSALAPLAEALTAHLARHGLEPSDLLGPPPASEDSRGWCPRCHAQYTTPDGECDGCAGVRRRPYPGSG